MVGLAGDVGCAETKGPEMRVNFADGNGNVEIYEHPKQGKIYAFGCDVAEGLSDGDRSTIFVINRDFEQVARFCGKLDTDLFAEEIVKMGVYYNNALIAVELNNMGSAVLSKIKSLNYTNLYHQSEFELPYDKQRVRLGWLTTVKSKALMLSEFIAAFRDRSIIIRDKELLQEMMTCSYGDDGSVDLNGKDLTVSACIAIQALKQTPHEIDYKAFIPNIDVQGPPAPETFQQRMKRLNKNGERYFD